MGERYTYGAETARSARRRRYEEAPRVPFMERTLRDMTTQLERRRDVTVRRLDRRAWRDAERVALKPFAHSSFDLPGCVAALRMLDAWGQLLKIRRDSGNSAASLPIENKIKAASKGGYSLPAASLDASSVEQFLATQPTWARMLLEVIFVEGWEFLRREVAYMLPDPLREAEIKAWEAVIQEHQIQPFKDWLGWFGGLLGVLPYGATWLRLAFYLVAEYCEAMRDFEAVIANAHKAIQDLQEAMVIVKLDSEPAPQRFKAARVLTIKRWTFELRAIAWSPKQMSMKPAERENAIKGVVVQLVISLASKLSLGALIHKQQTNRDLGDEQSFPAPDVEPSVSGEPCKRSLAVLASMGIS